METTVTGKIRLTKEDLYKIGAFDKGGRWYLIEVISDYFRLIRVASRNWPLSYWKAAKTYKFYKWLYANELLHLIR